MTLSISDTQHNNALPCAECHGECRVIFTITLSVFMLNVAMLCRYAECRLLVTIILSVIMLNIAMLRLC